jgi:hypothetical protein
MRPAFRAVAAAVVVAVAAMLLWPAGPKATTTSVRTAQHRVTLTVDDPMPGPNTLDLEVAATTGGVPVADALEVELVMPQMGHALPAATAARVGEARHRVAEIEIPMSGYWEVVVSLSATDQAVLPLIVD